MKLIYTHANLIIVANMQNVLENNGIDTFLKNEHLSAAAGEVSPFDAWPEVWIPHDSDYDKAKSIIDNITNNDNSRDWYCPQCGELNDASFEICWQCGHSGP